MSSCSVGSVAKAIRQLTNISGEIRVKRKYKTTDTGKLSKWCYIVQAEEGLLEQLDGKWEPIYRITIHLCVCTPMYVPDCCMPSCFAIYYRSESFCFNA